MTTEWRTEAAESNQSLVSAKLLMCSFRSSFALKSQLLQDFQNALPQPQLATFVSKVSKNFADTAMCSAVAPALTGFVFAWEKRSAHYWQTFAVHFPQVGDIKTLLSNLQSARALSEEPLREAPPKNQDIPETESNQSLVSAKLLMCSFRSSFALRFSKRIASASAGHFCLQSLQEFCRYCHVLSCGPRFDRVCFCLGEKISNSGRPGFFDGNSKAVCNGCLRTM